MSSHVSLVNVNLVEQILEQGQRLRNSIVQSILNNDPLNTEIMTNTDRSATNISQPLQLQIEDCDRNRNLTMKNQIEAYLQGEHMTLQEEQEVLNALQSMSAAELCKTTERTYTSYNKPCNCDICHMYETQNLSCDIKRSTIYSAKEKTEVPPINLKQAYDTDIDKTNVLEMIKDTYRSQTANYLKYVDSLQITVHSLTLSEAGLRKVSMNEVDTKSKVPSSVGHTYFVEYAIPSLLQKSISSKSTFSVDKNSVRLCSRKLNSNGL